MKTPEEIKKGLRFCCDVDNEHIDKCELGCPYHIKGQIVCAITSLLKDALAYIEQLEERSSLRGACPEGKRNCGKPYKKGEDA